MALSSTVIDYKGRTVDYLAFDDIKAAGDALLTQQLVKPKASGALISGIQKVIQRFLLELLTGAGSLDYLPGRGTMLMPALQAGVIRTTQDLFSYFNVAAKTAKENVVAEEIDSDPDDERIADVTLLSASLLGDTAVINISFVTVAGDSLTVLYPLRVSAI